MTDFRYEDKYWSNLNDLVYTLHTDLGFTTIFFYLIYIHLKYYSTGYICILPGVAEKTQQSCKTLMEAVSYLSANDYFY